MGTSNFATIAISAAVGAVVAMAIAIGAYFLLLRPPVAAGTITGPSPTPAERLDQIPPDPEVPAEDVTAIELNTSYKGYFDDPRCADAKVRCRMLIKFRRDGSAERTMFVKAAGETTEKPDATSSAKVSAEAFDKLARLVVANGAFRAWRNGMAITVSNTSLRVEHKNGTKTVLSNVDEKATTFLELIDAVRQLDRSLDWKTAG